MDPGRRLGDELFELRLGAPRAAVAANPPPSSRRSHIEAVPRHGSAMQFRTSPRRRHRNRRPRRRLTDAARHTATARADAGIALGPIGARLREQPHPALSLAGDQAVTIVFDLVNLLRSNRRLRCAGRDAPPQGRAERARRVGGLGPRPSLPFQSFARRSVPAR
jgi:hypothetical protein